MQRSEFILTFNVIKQTRIMEQTLKQKQLAFLEETVNHYNLNNRCVGSNNECCYSPISLGLEGISEGCAIGRHLDPELAIKLDKENPSDGVLVESVMVHLPDNLLELQTHFLRKVQILHDNTKHWDENGLSEYGKEQVESLKIFYGL